jgi:hypothetical protein
MHLPGRRYGMFLWGEVSQVFVTNAAGHGGRAQ